MSAEPARIERPPDPDAETLEDLSVCPKCLAQLYPDHPHGDPDCAYIRILQAAYIERVQQVEAVKEVFAAVLDMDV